MTYSITIEQLTKMLTSADDRKDAVTQEQIKWNKAIEECGFFYITDSANFKLKMVYGDTNFPNSEMLLEDFINYSLGLVPLSSCSAFLQNVHAMLTLEDEKDEKIVDRFNNEPLGN